ncbi:M28 family peptidase [Xenorhabdus nematophila]|uniref:N-acetylpuromycin N-acetylhydrolase n=1 Tax=Xenorhabdus nematophila (strain ATCC 19061 / DSM 3370 / CCUG 14189 / LMG 1036 / NCIMB 9965 / AN6) TaxID=406817 RepID=D3VEC6_XENNA|nr:M28 family peptidase [Xenorhabdus nematophila]CEE90874.1 putative N-acetylpuromycin N-acetylhydrolase precursor [Xenorhabdus nematophila str. Anatoliense]CEF29080.1 putative N-acetylpuromycin N-acetylhydrolase precursor [Xenorhabdus nematophila str. Websteri]AYA41891.1 M28 family peptidase [Xenorhabdus nematophila]KHD29318.1 N-acetylpuromycin N-acetylhydrolase [Xenorhabdus nematophila]MBA0020621.1 M28 family peptidase [Xenorhabdus nematophila]
MNSTTKNICIKSTLPFSKSSLCLLVAVASLFFPAFATATIKDTNSVITSSKVDNVLQHIQKLQEISDNNGGNREAGSNGHAESVQYFSEQLRNAGLKVWTEKFEFLYSKAEHAQLMNNGKMLDLVPAMFSSSTPGPISAPPHFIGGNGCEKQQYLDVPRGSIVIIQESTHCTTQHQHLLASESGARAAIIASHTDTPLYILLKGTRYLDIPLVGISHPTYIKIHSDPSSLMLDVLMITERRWSMNLIAENTGTNNSPAIEVGAHLDSVPQGPGINDNATSAALLLDHAISHANQPKSRTYRYMFWSAEEFVFAGSWSYLQTVTKPDSIYAYVNLEMQTSPNSGYFYTQDTSGGNVSQKISNSIIEAYQKLGIEAEVDTNTIPRSDDSSYKDAGIPTGGLWGGSFEIKTREQAIKWGGQAGYPFDGCYHRQCDNYGHVDQNKLYKTQFVLHHLLAKLDHAHD